MKIADEFNKLHEDYITDHVDFVFNEEVAASYYPDLLEVIKLLVVRGDRRGIICPSFFWRAGYNLPDSGITERLPNNLSRKQVMVFVKMLRADGFKAKVPFFSDKPHCISWELPKTKPEP